jgi:hypothetical protein
VPVVGCTTKRLSRLLFGPRVGPARCGLLREALADLEYNSGPPGQGRPANESRPSCPSHQPTRRLGPFVRPASLTRRSSAPLPIPQAHTVKFGPLAGPTSLQSEVRPSCSPLPKRSCVATGGDPAHGDIPDLGLGPGCQRPRPILHVPPKSEIGWDGLRRHGHVGLPEFLTPRITGPGHLCTRTQAPTLRGVDEGTLRAGR